MSAAHRPTSASRPEARCSTSTSSTRGSAITTRWCRWPRSTRSALAAVRSPIIGAGGQFQVGPRSAGSEPGPCCYGRGGSEPTATDCLVALGRIDPASFLGGRLPLKVELATAAIAEKLAKPLDQSVEEAALGAIKILTHNMVQAIEINSVRRGYDPRDFALVAFGGGGPLFACDIARELGIPAVVIPTAPGLTSGARPADHRRGLRTEPHDDAVRVDRGYRRGWRRPMPNSKPICAISLSPMASRITTFASSASPIAAIAARVMSCARLPLRERSIAISSIGWHAPLAPNIVASTITNTPIATYRSSMFVLSALGRSRHLCQAQQDATEPSTYQEADCCFLGSHSVKALVDAGHDVRLLVRSPARIAPALAPHGLA